MIRVKWDVVEARTSVGGRRLLVRRLLLEPTRAVPRQLCPRLVDPRMVSLFGSLHLMGSMPGPLHSRYVFTFYNRHLPALVSEMTNGKHVLPRQHGIYLVQHGTRVEALGRQLVGEGVGSTDVLGREAEGGALSGEAGAHGVGLHDLPAQGPAGGAELLYALGLGAEQVLVDATEAVDGAQDAGGHAGADEGAEGGRPEASGVAVRQPGGARLVLVLGGDDVAEADLAAAVQALVALLVGAEAAVGVVGDLVGGHGAVRGRLAGQRGGCDEGAGADRGGEEGRRRGRSEGEGE